MWIFEADNVSGGALCCKQREGGISKQLLLHSKLSNTVHIHWKTDAEGCRHAGRNLADCFLKQYQGCSICGQKYALHYN